MAITKITQLAAIGGVCGYGGNGVTGDHLTVILMMINKTSRVTTVSHECDDTHCSGTAISWSSSQMVIAVEIDVRVSHI